MPRKHGPRIGARTGMETHGATPSALFRCRRGNGQPHRRRRAAAVHVAAIAEPANPRSRGRSARGTVQPQRARRRADGIRQGISRPCAARARAGRRRRRSGAPRRASRQAGLRARLSDRAGNDMAAARDAGVARRIAEHRRDGVERLFARSRRRRRARQARPCVRAHRAGAGSRLSRGPSREARRADAERSSADGEASDPSVGSSRRDVRHGVEQGARAARCGRALFAGQRARSEA